MAVDLKTRNKTSPSSSWDAHTALIALETGLGFMCSFLVLDKTLPPSRRGALPAFGKWTTMLPYGETIAKQCAPFPHLMALARCLQSICNATVVACGARGGVGREGRAEELKADFAQGKIKMGGTAESTAKAEMVTLLNAATATHVLAAEAAALLPLQVLKGEYPKAAGEVEKGFAFGGVGLAPETAVKMAWVLLGEWAEKNAEEKGVKAWKRTLKSSDVGL